MAILSPQVKEQLEARFGQRLTGPVQLHLYVRPGPSRLIVPGRFTCATCDDARELLGEVAAAAPDLVDLLVTDLTNLPPDEGEEVPTLLVAAPEQEARIRFQGLPGGFEFATVVDAIERVSRAEAGLSPESLEQLAKLTEPAEVMVFVTPT